MTVVLRSIAVLLAAILAGGAAWWLQSSADLAERPPGDRITTAVQGLSNGPVHVADELDGWLSDEQLDQIGTPIESGDLPVRVLVWEDTNQGGYRTTSEALRRLSAELGKPVVYVMANPASLTVEEYDLRTSGMARLADSPHYEEVVLDAQETTDRIVAFLQELDAGSFVEQNPRESSYWGGTGGMIAAIVLFTLLLGATLTGVGAVVWFRLRARRSAP